MLDNVRHASGNAFPVLEDGALTQLPAKHSFLHLTGPAEGQYDLVRVEKLDLIPLVAPLLKPHGKLYLVVENHRVAEAISFMGKFGLHWVECKDYPPYSEIVARKIRAFNCPIWNGQQGKIMVHDDWGWGDAIMNMRWITPLRAFGEVIVEARPGSEALYGCETITQGHPLPPYDYQIEINALGRTMKKPIPQPPYIFSEPKNPPLDGFNVGVTWHGHHLSFSKYRFLNPEWFKKFLKIPNVKLWSLQQGPCPPFMSSVDMENWSDTAAVVNQMDMYMGVDTSVAHLSAAMNKPTWVLACQKEYHSPFFKPDIHKWYPSVKIFRGTEPDNEHLVAMAARELAQTLICRTFPLYL